MPGEPRHRHDAAADACQRRDGTDAGARIDAANRAQSRIEAEIAELREQLDDERRVLGDLEDLDRVPHPQRAPAVGQQVLDFAAGAFAAAIPTAMMMYREG